MKFHTQPLLQQATVGETLKRTREQQSNSVTQIARHIHVAPKYLRALEEGRYNDLPSPVYIKNYLKQYVAYLGLSWQQVERLYEQEISVYHDTPLKIFDPKRLQSTQKSSSGAIYHQKAFLIPRAVKMGLFLLLGIALATYFMVGVVRFVRPPTLSVTQPAQDQIVQEHRLRVEGRSQAGAMVTINDQQITLDPEGFFAEDVILHEGVNTIRVSAKTARSRERVIMRYVIYELPQEKEGEQRKNN